MSFLRALRAYIGLGPDEDIEDRYLYELNSRRRELDLDELEADDTYLSDESAELELDADDVVIVTPGSAKSGRAGSRRASNAGRHQTRNTSSLDGRRSERASRNDRSIYGDRRERSEVDRLPASEFIDDFDLQEELGMVSSDGDVINLDTDRDFDVIDGGDGQAELDRLLAADAAEAAEVEANEPVGARRGSGRRGGRIGSDSGPTPNDERQETEADDSYPKAVVRSLDSMRAKPRTLIPESFADAKLVADEFKRDIPVLLNLQSLDRDLARRLIDFASGICYAMDGSMEKIASQVFLLIPESVEVSDEDRRRIEERGYAR